jgi:hypothetical protein
LNKQEREEAMKQQYALYWLVPLVAVLALVAAGVGLFYQDGGSSFAFTTVRGGTVQIWGQGWYKYDSPIGALGFTAGDLITLVLAIPVLVISILLYHRGSLRGGLLLTGALAYFLYNYTSMGFGAAYNNLFLAYIIIFSASLFGLILALTSFDVQTLPSHFGDWSASTGHLRLPDRFRHHPHPCLARVVHRSCIVPEQSAS